MDTERADVVWRSCIAPSSITHEDVEIALFKLPTSARVLGAASGLIPRSVRVAQHDDVLQEIVQEAQRSNVKVGEVVDKRPAFRRMFYDRARDALLQPAENRALQFEALQQKEVQHLLVGEPQRLHGDDQSMFETRVVQRPAAVAVAGAATDTDDDSDNYAVHYNRQQHMLREQRRRHLQQRLEQQIQAAKRNRQLMPEGSMG